MICKFSSNQNHFDSIIRAVHPKGLTKLLMDCSEHKIIYVQLITSNLSYLSITLLWMD